MISAAPQEIIQPALEGIVPPDHIFGTRFRYNEVAGEVDSFIRASAGWARSPCLRSFARIWASATTASSNIGDGSSDMPVMMHVNHYDGLTIAISDAKFISRVAKRTVLSANAMSGLVPVLEQVMNWNSAEIRHFLAPSFVARMGQGAHRPTLREGWRL